MLPSRAGPARLPGSKVAAPAASLPSLEARWRQWRRHDPINLVDQYKRNLKTLRGIYIDCGWRDQYHIHYGTRILSKRLSEENIRHVYEEFDDNHSDIDYRMDTSLPFLYRALK